MLAMHRAWELPCRPEEKRWLVEGLWAEEAVGIVGGEPKCCKSFLALQMAVAVASGCPALGRFPVSRPGPVLLFAAEDALHEVRRRLAGICAVTGVELASLDLYVISVPVVRLDHAEDRRELEASVLAVKPRLLVLDPFVRLHRVDENVSAEVAPLLAYLRELQRRHHTAVLLVHHARKGASHVRGGQALRGSSELHAWGDSNLYLRRHQEFLQLTVEHRAAAAPDPLPLALSTRDAAVALEVIERQPQPSTSRACPDPAARIEEVLAKIDGALPLARLRQACQIRTATLCATLATLRREGRVTKSPDGYRLATKSDLSSELPVGPCGRAEAETGNPTSPPHRVGG